MSGPTQGMVAVLSIALVTVAGDYCLKRASLREQAFGSVWFAVGCGVYAATAVGWVVAMRHLKLATLGVLFSLLSLLLLAVLGYVAFGERLSWQEVAGIVLAVGAILLLGRFAG